MTHLSAPPTTVPFFTYSSDAGAAVRFDHATRRFGDITALDGVDLRLETGSTVALLGPMAPENPRRSP